MSEVPGIREYATILADPLNFIVEVQENDHTDWLRNGMHFATADEADRWAFDLMSSWFGIQEYRVIDTRSGEVVKA